MARKKNTIFVLNYKGGHALFCLRTTFCRQGLSRCLFTGHLLQG